MALSLWLAFVTAAVAISVSPGPGAFAAMAAGLGNGFRRGYWLAIGLQLGLLLQLAVVAAGIGALIVSSPLAFESLRWFGVAYLGWLALAHWRATPAAGTGPAPDRQAAIALLLRGFLVNCSNPKALLFSFAVLPQFIDSTAPLVPQYAVMAATLVTVDLIVMAGYTTLAARVLPLLGQPGRVRTINRGFGLLFVAAAASLAAFRRG